MRTIDADKLLQIIHDTSTTLTKEELIHCINAQSTVCNIQKSIDGLLEEIKWADEEPERKAAYMHSIEIIKYSICPEYHNQFYFQDAPLEEGDKIYYIDYEESGNSYTICDIFFKKGNDFCKGGLSYSIHSDQLNGMTGYYDLLVSQVDNPKDRFFSSPEKAHDAYAKFLERTGQTNEEGREV